MSNGNSLLDFFFRGSSSDDVLGAILGYQQFDKLSDIGAQAAKDAEALGERAQADAAFRPFSVSTGFGGVQATPEGGYSTSLSPFAKARQKQLRRTTSGMLKDMDTPDVSGIQRRAFKGAKGFLTGAMMPTADREAAIFERIRATQRPEEQRQQLALEERLAGQGRTGLRTSMFGGSPEQLALSLASEQAKNEASLAAIQQAQAEQMQQAGLAESMFGLGSGAAALPATLQEMQLANIGTSMGLEATPEQLLLSTINPAISIADLSGTARREGADLLAELGAAGIAGRTAAETAKAEGLSAIYSALIGAGGNIGAAGAAGAAGDDDSGLSFFERFFGIS